MKTHLTRARKKQIDWQFGTLAGNSCPKPAKQNTVHTMLLYIYRGPLPYLLIMQPLRSHGRISYRFVGIQYLDQADTLTLAVLFKLLESYDEKLLEGWKQAVSKLVGVVPGRQNSRPIWLHPGVFHGKPV